MLNKKELMASLVEKENASREKEHEWDAIAANKNSSKREIENAQSKGWYEMGIRHALKTLRVDIMVGGYHG